jgi:hypothetical protein
MAFVVVHAAAGVPGLIFTLSVAGVLDVPGLSDSITVVDISADVDFHDGDGVLVVATLITINYITAVSSAPAVAVVHVCCFLCPCCCWSSLCFLTSLLLLAFHLFLVSLLLLASMLL